MDFVENSSNFQETLVVFLTVTLFSLTINYYLNRRRIFNLGSKLPGPKYWPIIGNILDLVDLKSMTLDDVDVLAKINRFHEIYDIYRLWIGHQLDIFVKSPEDAEIYYNSYKLLDRAGKLSFFNPILGKGLLFASGDEWKKAKKVMETAFPYLILKNFVSLIQDETKILIERLKREIGKTKFTMFPYIRDCTFDIICNGAFEFELKAQEGELEFLKVIELLKEFTIKRAIAPWLQLDFLYKMTKEGKRYYQVLDAVTQIFDEHLEKRMKYLEDERKIKTDKSNEDKESSKLFWRKLLENKNLDREELRHHVYTTIATGYETTANSICFILVMLALHHDIQEKAYQELMSIISDSVFDNEKLQKLEYLERVINETLRLFPTVPINSRKCTEDVQFGKHLVPKGSDVQLNIFALHRDPNQFQNPNKFNPDNFLPQNVAKRHPYAFVPFSTGPRRCIGSKFAMMSMKIIVGSVLMNYKIECDYKSLEEIPIRAEITIRMLDDCPIRLLNR